MMAYSKANARKIIKEHCDDWDRANVAAVVFADHDGRIIDYVTFDNSVMVIVSADDHSDLTETDTIDIISGG